MGKEQIVIGKRVTIGAGIGGVVTFAVAVWDMLNPDKKLDASAVLGLQTAVVMFAQIFVANKYGITTKESLEE